MDDYLPEEDWGEEWTDNPEEFETSDPFDGLTKRDQDVFFQVLDLIPTGQRELAMDYFMSNPKKIRAVVDNVKQKKELIKNKDVDGLKELFEKERVVIQQIEDQATAAGDLVPEDFNARDTDDEE